MSRIQILILFSVIIISSCNFKEQNANSRSAINDIVIIDVADFNREAITKQIRNITLLQPKVVAIDLFFSGKQTPYIDSLFKQSLSQCNKLVMPSIIENYTGQDINYEELSGCDPEFQSTAKTGFVNTILEQDKFQTLKRFSVVEKVHKEQEYHFAVRAAMEFDSLKTMMFIENNSRVIDVKYSGNASKFKIISAYDALNNRLNPSDINGKIVLLGTFSISDPDIFFTPLNSKAEPFMPDMFGVVYLANIVVQVLDYVPHS